VNFSRSLFAAILIITSPGLANALTVTLTEWNTYSTNLLSGAISFSCCGGQDLVFEPAALPFVNGHRAQVGNAISETRYALSSAEFVIDIVEHFQPFGGGSARSMGSIYFVLDQSIEYSVTGEYSYGGGPTEMQLEATLVDLNTGVLLFDNFQWSRVGGEAAEYFLLGGEGGDRENRLSGSLTGILNAGTLYRLMYRANIGNTASATTPGTASGYLSLVFVPEPSTGLVVGLGLVGIAAGRR
jgi:hypothetical protein